MSVESIILLEALRLVKESPDLEVGICQNVDDMLRRSGKIHSSRQRLGIRMELETRFSRWSKFSGSAVHPVPGLKDAPESAKIAYMHAEVAGTLWDRTTEYGQLRWELLDFLITELEKEVNQNA